MRGFGPNASSMSNSAAKPIGAFISLTSCSDYKDSCMAILIGADDLSGSLVNTYLLPSQYSE